MPVFVIVGIEPSLITTLLIRGYHLDDFPSGRLNKVDEILIEVTEGLIKYDISGHFSGVKPNFLEVLLRRNFAIGFGLSAKLRFDPRKHN